MKPLVCLPAFCLLPFLSSASELSRGQIEFFEKSVRPVLVKNCYQCHSKDAKNLKGGLYLDSASGVLNGGNSGPVIEPGNPEDSRLVQALRYGDKDLRMPPKKKLSEKDIRILENWVKMGAPDPRVEESPSLITRNIDIEKGRQFWAFQPVQEPKLPKGNGRWQQSGLDRLVQSKHQELGLSPAEPAPAASLLRRLHFDLTGLPPSPDKVVRFLSNHKNDPAAAIAKVVDQLLDSPQFGERWGRHWLDVARYAESTGMERNCTYPQAWRYRDYVIQAFNDDKPFDQFIREQIAGDLLAASSDEEAQANIIATGFLAMGPKSLNERDRTQFMSDVHDEQIDITTRAFMGLTVSCARCHDHKFDPIPTKDYYAIYGIFQSSKLHFGTDGTGNRQKSTLLPLGGEEDGLEEAIAEHKERLEAAKQENKDNQKKTQHYQKKIKTTKDKEERKTYQDRITRLKKEKKIIAKKISKLTKNKPAPKNLAMGIGEAANPSDARIHVRGDPHKFGERIPRGYLSVVDVPNASPINKEQSGRLELAGWIASPDNPLTSRVLANRIWKHLFGEGIVRSVDNFGKTGERPDNEVLLDYLATRVVKNGWSVKKTIREIVLSQTYQLSSAHNGENFKIDPENRHWWRAHHRRLDAESIRDAILASSGHLELEPVKGSGVTALGETNIGRESTKIAALNSPHPHRSVYHPILRNNLPDSLKLFDFAEPSIIVGKRQITTVPSQALYLMNSPFILQQSDVLAKRINGLSDGSRTNRVHHAYLLTLGREPTKDESKKMVQYLASEEGNLPNLCQVLIASAEFRYIE